MQKTIVITGASDGIGAEAAEQLVQLGHHVVIVGRNPEKTQQVAQRLGMPFHIADFANLSDVVRLAEELKQYPRIDVLANNAGAAMNKRTLTKDGVERTFQVNVLSPFLLTNLLAEKLCSCGATVVQTSSIAANFFGKSFDVTDVQNQNDYTPLKAYGRAKLCNILFTRQLHKRFGEQGLCAVAYQPGVPRTNFACESTKFLNFMFHSPFKYLFTISKKRSAKRLVHFALACPSKDFVCGETYTYKKKFKVKFQDKDGNVAQQLWEICSQLVEQHLH